MGMVTHPPRLGKGAIYCAWGPHGVDQAGGEGGQPILGQPLCAPSIPQCPDVSARANQDPVQVLAPTLPDGVGGLRALGGGR